MGQVIYIAKWLARKENKAAAQFPHIRVNNYGTLANPIITLDEVRAQLALYRAARTDGKEGA